MQQGGPNGNGNTLFVRSWMLRRRRVLLTRGRRAGAEAIGTALLLAAIVGSGVMGERLASGNVAVALLANTLATASALVALIATFGPVSGAHFNPLVSLLAWLSGALPAADTAAYILAQVVGAIGGVWIAHAMFSLPLLERSMHVRAGVAQAGAEAVATFGLLMVIGLGGRRAPATIPFTVAAYIAAAYWFTSSTSFANPAVTVARSLSDTFAGIRPVDVPGFLGGQGLGFVAALVALRWLSPAVAPEG